VLWTILTVILVVGAFLVIVSLRFMPGGKNIGEVEEQHSRLWSGLWKKEDADRLR
jgi:hypothetical protein